MKAKIVRDSTLKALRDSIAENLDTYRAGEFSPLKLDPSQCYELTIDIDPTVLTSASLPSSSDLMDVTYCKLMLAYLPGITPYDARDERLWVYLAHTDFLSYARARWPIPPDDEKAVEHIKRHFFAASNRQIERDNIASRLWWMGHLCDRVKDIDLDAALEAFLLRSDVRANIVERPTLSQSVNVFSVLIEKLIASKAGKQALFERNAFRRLMAAVNSVGGFKLLDCLPDTEVEAIFDHIISVDLGISAI